ncbi:MAG: hypothetical protein JNL72_15570 [Flavipsychrobacter sp.]|nr:hypothetical protein [Flavipsychrobacter sp.]
MRIVLFSLAVLLSVPSLAAPDAKALLRKMSRQLASHTSVQYTAYQTFKGPDRDDTLFFQQHVAIARDKGDVQWGAKFRMADFERSNDYLFYNRERICFVDQLKGRYRVVTPDSKGDRLPQFYAGLVWEGFIRPEVYEAYQDRNARWLKDTTIDGQLCYQLELKEPGSRNREVLAITKRGLTPVMRREYHYHAKEWEYNEVLLRATRYDQVDNNQFSRRQLPAWFTERR